MKKCPYCVEEIHGEALVCPHCKREVYKRKGWWKIIFGAILFLCLPLLSALSTLFLGPLAFISPVIIGVIAAVFVISGISSVMILKKR